MTNAVDRSGPFSHASSSVSRTMVLVMLALTPASLFNFWLFGWPAVFLFGITVGACVATEALCLRLSGKDVGFNLMDGSSVLTGWLLAMSLPPWAPWWVGVVGAIVAIAITKQAFGGLGQNVFNPAMVARVALLVSFPVVMTTWVAPHPMFSPGAPGLVDGLAITLGGAVPDAMTSATPLGYVKTELTRGVSVLQSAAHLPDLSDSAVGLRAGSLGETSALLILIGGLFLMVRRVISWHIPVSLMAGLAFSNTKTALAHSLSYDITLRHGVAHGIACSFSLPLVLEMALGADDQADAALLSIFDAATGELAVQRLRKKLGAEAIETRRGQGYVLAL